MKIEKDLIGKTVILGMSGGVDSSVAALLLKQRGAHVIGLFMKNWTEFDSQGICQASKEYKDVVKVCEQLRIPHYCVEFVEEYREKVFNPFLDGLHKGQTPNPDILCNQEIKFKHFFNKAMELGGDYLSTGHYCQEKKLLSGVSHLITGTDKNKDQTYFLYTVKENVLRKVIFPIGHLCKKDVRKIAKDHGLSTHNKKDSTGICFIGKRNFKKFLANYISFHPGPFKTLDGNVVGEHSGTSFYTIGQRKGLGLGGPGEPWFIVGKDQKSNTIYVERGEHPALYTKTLLAKSLNWVNPYFKKGLSGHRELSLKAKIRYRQEARPCRVKILPKGELRVDFSSPQRAITPGQSIVFYSEVEGEEVCHGGAIIISAIASKNIDIGSF